MSVRVVGDTEATVHHVFGGKSVGSREGRVPLHRSVVGHAEDSGGVRSNVEVVCSISGFEITTSVEMAVKRNLSPGADRAHLLELSVPSQTTVNLVESHDHSITLVTTSQIEDLVV